MEYTPSGHTREEAFDRAREAGMPVRELRAPFEPTLGGVYKSQWVVTEHAFRKGKTVGTSARTHPPRMHVFIKQTCVQNEMHWARQEAYILWKHLLAVPGVPYLIEYVICTDSECIVTEAIDGADVLEWAIVSGAVSTVYGPAGQLLPKAKSALLEVSDDAPVHLVRNAFCYRISPRSRFIVDLTRRFERPRIGEPELLMIMTQLTEILLDAHMMGIAHRDVKAENVMLDMCGQVFLADWEFACTCRTGRLPVGTVGYTPPEILAGDRYDPLASDIWSLGVFAYLCASGRFPFAPKPGRPDLMIEAMYAEARSYVRGVAGVAFADDIPLSAEFREAVRSMLTYEADHRPSIVEVRTSPWMRTAADRPALSSSRTSESMASRASSVELASDDDARSSPGPPEKKPGKFHRVLRMLFKKKKV